jgi:rod shape-determining protein MreC
MQQTRFLRTALVILSFIIVVVLLHVIGALRVIERPLGALLHRSSQKLYTISIWEQQAYEMQTFSQEELQSAFVTLQEKYRSAIVDQATLRALSEENENLKRQLQFFSQKEWLYYTAPVTAKQIDPFVSTVSLYLPGADTLIQSGAPAVTDDGMFVGIVIRIEGSTVLVRLLTDGQTKIGGALLNEEKTVGVIEGGFGKSIRMNFIPQNEKISAGDIVVTSGLSPQVPYGLTVGTVEAIEKEPYQPFQSAIISPLINPNSLRLLSIVVEAPSQ